MKWILLLNIIVVIAAIADMRKEPAAASTTNQSYVAHTEQRGLNQGL